MAWLDDILFGLVVAAAVGAGVVGGLLFAFSISVMPALGRQPDAAGMRVMQDVNVVILNPLFLALFMGTAVVALALIGSPLAGASSEGLTLRLAGALLYLVGVLGITMAVNVPLNNRLAALDATGGDSWPQWRHYLERWTWWNHVRALAGVLASLALTLSAARLG
jgi:uncharacterized membrane protein